MKGLIIIVDRDDFTGLGMTSISGSVEVACFATSFLLSIFYFLLYIISTRAFEDSSVRVSLLASCVDDTP